VELYLHSPLYVFMAWCSVKAQGQLYLYLTFTVLDMVVKRKIPSPRLESNPRTQIVQSIA
jgi:hypothetical protein